MATLFILFERECAEWPRRTTGPVQGPRAALLDECEAYKLETYGEWRTKAIAKYAKTDEQLRKLFCEDGASTTWAH